MSSYSRLGEVWVYYNLLVFSEGGRFNEKTVCEVALQVLDSLEFIHSQGYVHKDVKVRGGAVSR